MRLGILFLVLILFFFTACVDDKVESPVADTTKEYFPLQLGRYIDYAIDSIVFDDAPGGNKKDTATFQIREQVTNFEISLSGDTLFYIHRLRREGSEQNWQLIDLWTASRTQTEATRTEENLKFRKMTFPLQDGKRWFATSYIPPSTTILIGTENVQAFQDWESVVDTIDVADQIGNFSFGDGDVIHIFQTSTDDGSTKRFVMEKYARNIGLVLRIDSILDSRCIELGDFTECLGKPWENHARKGYILSQVMIDHN